MGDDIDARSAAGRELLAGLDRLTPGQARRVAIRHTDAFSTERREARAQARAIARELGVVAGLDTLMRDAARAADVPAVPEASRDTFRQVTTDAAVAAFLGDDLDADARDLLVRPWARATRRRRVADPRPPGADGTGTPGDLAG